MHPWSPPHPTPQKEQEEQLHSDNSHSSVNYGDKKLIISLKYTTVTESILCIILLMHVTKQHWHYIWQEQYFKKQNKQKTYYFAL